MDDLEALVASSEFAAVKAAVDALDPMLLLDPKVGAHLRALRTGMNNLATVDLSPPEQPAPEEPAPEAA